MTANAAPSMGDGASLPVEVPERQPSKILPALFSGLDLERPLNVLDMGPAIPETLTFFSHLRCRLHFVDFYGEAVLELLRSRLVPGGLYLLDEPETPLSPLRQLALLALLREMVDRDCQFLVATHSPILMALPGAEILVFEEGRIEPRDWEEVEHVALTRDFLRDPGAFLRRL